MPRLLRRLTRVVFNRYDFAHVFSKAFFADSPTCALDDNNEYERGDFGMRRMWMTWLLRSIATACTILMTSHGIPAYADTAAANAPKTTTKKKTAAAPSDAAPTTKASDGDLRKAAEEAASKYPTDLENYLGDTIVLNRDTPAVRVVIGKNNEIGEEPVCIPAGTYLKGGKLVDVINRDYAFVPACSYPEMFKERWNCDAGFVECGEDPKRIEPGTMLKIQLKDFEKVPPNRYGVTFGGLVVPFKFQLTGKQDYKASASAAPYMGYRFGFEGHGVELAPVVFAGIGVVSATKTKEKTSDTNSEGETTTKTKETTTELASFTYGLGIIGSLKGGMFHFGGMLGFDHTGSGKGYKYNDKPWFALELGASFN